jgi:uncharacterized Zn-finger protein
MSTTSIGNQEDSPDGSPRGTTNGTRLAEEAKTNFALSGLLNSLTQLSSNNRVQAITMPASSFQSGASSPVYAMIQSSSNSGGPPAPPPPAAPPNPSSSTNLFVNNSVYLAQEHSTSNAPSGMIVQPHQEMTYYSTTPTQSYVLANVDPRFQTSYQSVQPSFQSHEIPNTTTTYFQSGTNLYASTSMVSSTMPPPSNSSGMFPSSSQSTIYMANPSPYDSSSSSSSFVLVPSQATSSSLSVAPQPPSADEVKEQAPALRPQSYRDFYNYECSTCQKRFRCKKHLKRHLPVQTEPKNFECEDCGKKFRRKDNLESHRRIHTGEMPYTCSICQKKFRFQSGLANHLKTHESSAPSSKQ